MDRFIDSHNHLHGFSFDDWELQGMCGMAGSVLSCGNPHVHREIWKRAPGPEDVRRLWESPLRMAEAAEAKHHIRAMCAVGVSSMTRVDGWERLIDALPGYLENERVAALGEVGLDPGQYFGFSWDLEDQAKCLEAQARMAAELKKPLILAHAHVQEPKGIPGRRGHARRYLSRGIQAPLSEDGYGSHRCRRVGPCAARGRSRGCDDSGFRARTNGRLVRHEPRQPASSYSPCRRRGVGAASRGGPHDAQLGPHPLHFERPLLHPPGDPRHAPGGHRRGGDRKSRLRQRERALRLRPLDQSSTATARTGEPVASLSLMGRHRNVKRLPTRRLGITRFSVLSIPRSLHT